MSCPYDDLKTNLSDTVDALLALRSERDRKQRIDDFINTLSDGVYRIEKNKLPEGLRAKCEYILAWPYDDLKQNLEAVLDVLISLRSERDAEAVHREK